MSCDNNISTTVRQGPVGWTYRYSVQEESFAFENVDLFWWHTVIINRWTWAFYIGAMYIATIFGLQRWMKNRPAMSLKTPLFFWNLAIGVVSTMGFCRTVPGLLKTVSEPSGLYDSICARNWLDTQTGFWTIVFILSKPVELGDTVFTVLRKKPLAFTQWYHHLVTMILCWILGPMLEPALISGMVINFGTHVLMYFYFAIKTIGYKVPKIVADIIITAEFLQMIVGLVFSLASMYYNHFGEGCATTDLSIKCFGFMYFSFFLLFGKLFYDSVVKSNKAGEMSKNDNNGTAGITVMGSCDQNDDVFLETTKKLN